MPRFTAQDMLKPKGTAGRPAVQASAPANTARAPSGPQVVKVPQGGQVTIRKATNGVIATVTDSDWGDKGQIVAQSASDLKIE